MSEQFALELLIAALAFAAGLVFRDLVWLIGWLRQGRPRGRVHAAGGEVHPGEAVVFDWGDPRPNATSTFTGTFGGTTAAQAAAGAQRIAELVALNPPGRHLRAVRLDDPE